MTYTVGEMAQLLGVAPSTLRYYDKEGLLPDVERSPGGMRVFHQKDFDWLQIIVCLKRTGMQLRDIRTYIDMTARGDETIEARLQLLIKQREAVKTQMAELQAVLDTLEFKCWLYETAKEAGTMAVLDNMAEENVPERYRSSYRQLSQKSTQPCAAAMHEHS